MSNSPPSALPSPKPRGLKAPLRSVLAVDAGSQCIRLLLVQSRLGRLRVVRREAICLQEEGLLSPEELKAHMQATLTKWGRPPIALALPQDVAVSQIVDVPPVPEAEARQLIEEETLQLGAVDDSAMVYDFTRVPRLEEHQQSFWVTFCQEDEIESRIDQLGLADQEFQEITTAANALITAWQVACPHRRNVVLVHSGAQNTTLVAIRDGVAIFATSFPMAGDFFTRAIARLSGISFEEAEALQRNHNLLSGDERLPGFDEIVDGWAAELERQLSECYGQPFDRAISLIATGGAFLQPGLQDYLTDHAGLRFRSWPADNEVEALSPAPGYEIAWGTALQALDYGQQPTSLLPASRRAAWKRRQGRQWLEFANALLLTVCLVVLTLGVWQKLSLIKHLQALASKVQSGSELVEKTDELNEDLLKRYNNVRPLFEHHQGTIDTLRSLALLQSARSNRALWYVLVADQNSYFAAPPRRLATNNPPDTPGEEDFEPWRRDTSATSRARPGLIAELCVPDGVDAARSTLSRVVDDLRQAPVFKRVDLLSEDRRRNMADPSVVLPDDHFALVLDFAATQFQPTTDLAPSSRSMGRTATPP